MSTTQITSEGTTSGIWSKSRTDSSVSIQSNRTSATLMLYPDERGTNKELPFVLGVSHSVDKDTREGFIQIPTMTGKRETRYFTFQQLIAALDGVERLEALEKRVADLEGLLVS